MLEQAFHLIRRTAAAATAVQNWVAFWSPTWKTRALAAPLASVAAVLSLALLSGIAVASLTILIVALVGLYLLLTDIFGISIAVEI